MDVEEERTVTFAWAREEYYKKWEDPAQKESEEIKTIEFWKLILLKEK